jgi:hypothetical protein
VKSLECDDNLLHELLTIHCSSSNYLMTSDLEKMLHDIFELFKLRLNEEIQSSRAIVLYN